jgi:hypothetical protein
VREVEDLHAGERRTGSVRAHRWIAGSREGSRIVALPWQFWPPR